LASRPILTQAVTTGILFATGDTMAQQLVEKKGFKNHDLSRTGRMVFYGGCMFGPAAVKWFGFLQKKIVIPGKPNLQIVARVLTDQTVFASTNLFCFLSTMALLEGTDPRKKLESTYFNALSKNWMVWPVVQMINFKFVPLPHQVLFVNFVSLGQFHTRSCNTMRDADQYYRLELLPQHAQQPARRRARVPTGHLSQHSLPHEPLRTLAIQLAKRWRYFIPPTHKAYTRIPGIGASSWVHARRYQIRGISCVGTDGIDLHLDNSNYEHGSINFLPLPLPSHPPRAFVFLVAEHGCHPRQPFRL
jgi:protein Mpv17